MKRREFIVLFGAAVAWPDMARAQQSTVPLIGFVHASSAATVTDRLDAFHTGLKQEGYVEGQNLKIEYRWANGDYDRLSSLASELVALRVTVLAAGTTVASVAAKAASPSIPMVFTGVGGDPVKLG